MPTVRCPSCRRALHLPEHRQVETAQCPLCRTTFETAAPPPPALPTPTPAAPEPVVRVRPVEDPQEEEEFDFAADEAPEVRADRHAIRSAASWLRAMGALGLSQLFLCGCFDLFDVDRRNTGNPDAMRNALLLLVVRLVGLMIVWSAAESFTRRRSLVHVQLGAIVALLLGGYMLYRAFPALRYLLEFIVPTPTPLNPNDAVARTIFGLFALTVGVPGIVGAVRTFAVLSRPGVRSLFAR